MYSVKSVTVMTGIPADTLRAWERRYQVVNPQRDKNYRRVYSSDDVVRLRLLGAVTNLGHPIGKLVDLDNAQLRGFLSGQDEKESTANEKLVSRLLDAIKDYRGDLIDEIVGSALVGLSPLEAARDVLSPTLKEVGELWHRKEINVAQEHFFSSSVERLLLAQINVQLKRHSGAAGMLFSTLSGERHGFGILLSAYIAASFNMRCFYFGPDLPVVEIISSAKETGCSIVTLSMIANPIERDHINQLHFLCGELSEQAQIWLGGSGAMGLMNDAEALPKNCKIIKNYDDFYDRVDCMQRKEENQKR